MDSFESRNDVVQDDYGSVAGSEDEVYGSLSMEERLELAEDEAEEIFATSDEAKDEAETAQAKSDRVEEELEEAVDENEKDRETANESAAVVRETSAISETLSKVSSEKTNKSEKLSKEAEAAAKKVVAIKETLVESVDAQIDASTTVRVESPGVALSHVDIANVKNMGEGKVRISGTLELLEGVIAKTEDFECEAYVDPSEGFFRFERTDEDEEEEEEVIDEEEDDINKKEGLPIRDLFGSFLAEITRQVAQSSIDVSGTDVLDTNVHISPEAFETLLGAMKPYADKETVEMVAEDALDLDRPLSRGSSSIFDRSMTSRTSTKARTRVIAMRRLNFASSSDSSKDGASVVVVVHAKDLIRRSACEKGSGRSDETGDCEMCDDGFASPQGLRCVPCEGDGTSNEERTRCTCKPGYELNEDGGCTKCDVESLYFSGDGESCELCDPEGGKVAADGSRCECNEGFENDPETGKCEVEDSDGATGGMNEDDEDATGPADEDDEDASRVAADEDEENSSSAVSKEGDADDGTPAEDLSAEDVSNMSDEDLEDMSEDDLQAMMDKFSF